MRWVSSSTSVLASVVAVVGSSVGVRGAGFGSDDLNVMVINVDVNARAFRPDAIVARPGDQVRFTVSEVGCTAVAQAAFDSPCLAVDSGIAVFERGEAPQQRPSLTVIVNDTEPVWLHCTDAFYCRRGMVAVINPPNAGARTLDAFRAKAMMSGDVPPGPEIATAGSSMSFIVQRSASNPSPQKIHAVRIAHGLLMCFSLLVFLPLGGLAMRALSFDGLVAFHMTTQLFFLTFTLTGFSLGVYLFTILYQTYRSQPHFILGTTVVAMLVLQPIFGFIAHSLYKKHKKKNPVTYLHVWWGRIIFILALTNGVLGLKLANSDIGGQKHAIIAFSVVVGFMGLLYIGVVLGTRKAKFSW